MYKNETGHRSFSAFANSKLAQYSGRGQLKMSGSQGCNANNFMLRHQTNRGSHTIVPCCCTRTNSCRHFNATFTNYDAFCGFSRQCKSKLLKAPPLFPPFGSHLISNKTTLLWYRPDDITNESTARTVPAHHLRRLHQRHLQALISDSPR